MEITIKQDKEYSLIITNEGFDNINYVNVIIKRQYSEEESNFDEYEIDVPIDELSSVVNSFLELKNKRDK